jgi:hypothetical protein
MFSSASGNWETPKEFFDAVNAVFHFTLGVCDGFSGDTSGLGQFARISDFKGKRDINDY